MQVEEIGNKLISNFQKKTLTQWKPSNDLIENLHNYIASFSEEEFQPISVINKNLLFIINDRLDLNKKVYRCFIDEAANKGFIFNYHQKLQIKNTLNYPEINLVDWYFNHIGKNDELIDVLQETEKRKNKIFIDLDSYLKQDPKIYLIIESIFCSYIYYSFDEKIVHTILNQDCQKKYFNNYWQHLKYFHGVQTSREKGLVILSIDSIIQEIENYDEILEVVFSLIVDAYFQLTNHCYLAIIIEEVNSNKWQLISDITIFSEKFLEHPIDRSYFRWRKVAEETLEYIKNLNDNICDFKHGNEGLTYKDCYLIYKNNREKCVLLFEKNERDERPIPCPKCRTLKIQGNSYPTIGVRSWECKNIFCGYKSKYNRGKRYSLSSIIRQQAILDSQNFIAPKILKNWRRDIVEVSSFSEIYDFLIQCYSLYGDTILVYGESCRLHSSMFGRKLKIKKINTVISREWKNHYYNLKFFKRFLIKKPIKSLTSTENLSSIPEITLYQGDSFNILSQLESNYLGGTVTSPPYYNARNYSQWSNIYCYLYDMYNIFNQVYRCLQEGSPLLINIFDYFDNEKIIVFSDMGKKRLILSSYISFICRYIGFNHLGNVAWDKGEIEGNRNFNQGNYSPYYQAPHNCWEHILIFSKGNPSFDITKMQKIIKEQPITKIVKGKNIYGHTAPFPEKVPSLLFSLITRDKIILDPFAGSMTTGRVALKYGVKSINIELHKQYCDLGLKLLEQQPSTYLQGSLF